MRFMVIVKATELEGRPHPVFGREAHRHRRTLFRDGEVEIRPLFEASDFPA